MRIPRIFSRQNPEYPQITPHAGKKIYVGGIETLGSLSLGGTTLNQLPIGLHVKIQNFNGRFEAYWATFGMLSWYHLIQNR